MPGTSGESELWTSGNLENSREAKKRSKPGSIRVDLRTNRQYLSTRAIRVTELYL